MALEKKKKLRKIEFTFDNDQMLENCHCEFYICIEEDGKEIAKTKLREVHDTDQKRKEIAQKAIRKSASVVV